MPSLSRHSIDLSVLSIPGREKITHLDAVISIGYSITVYNGRNGAYQGCVPIVFATVGGADQA